MTTTHEPITYLDVDLWNKHLARTGEHLHVRLDGEDVTTRCFRACRYVDRINGDVWLFKVNDEGHKYIDRATGKPATEMRSGRLDIEPGGPF